MTNPTDGPDPDEPSEEELARWAKWVFEWRTHTAIENMAGRSAYPIIDCTRDPDRTYETLADFGVVEAYHEPSDESHALPVRITIGVNGIKLEIGEHDFDEREIDVLRRCLSAYHRMTAPQRTSES